MISAVVHTYNEEKNIEKCLASLSWVNEIIVIDMGSTDKTCQIAKDYKSKIYQHPYTGFVEPARNFGILKTSGDWIIIVDADEEIPKTLAKYLTLEIQKPSADYYRIARKNIIFGKWIKHAGWWPDYQVRFFKKGSVSWTEKIHGIPLTRGTGTDVESSDDLNIVHHNYQTIEQYLTRLNRYSNISAKELYLSNQRFTSDLLFKKPLQEFINRFFVWEGYKDNIHGLALALLQSLAELATCLKLWELESFREEKLSLEQIDKSVTQGYKQNKYWLTAKLLKQSQNPIYSLIIRLKRKLLNYV